MPCPTQWWRDLFRCRIDLLTFSMGFNIGVSTLELIYCCMYLHRTKTVIILWLYNDQAKCARSFSLFFTLFPWPNLQVNTKNVKGVIEHAEKVTFSKQSLGFMSMLSNWLTINVNLTPSDKYSYEALLTYNCWQSCLIGRCEWMPGFYSWSIWSPPLISCHNQVSWTIITCMLGGSVWTTRWYVL